MKSFLTDPATLRVALYFVAPMLGTLPGITYSDDAGHILTINLDAALPGIGAAAVAAFAIFAKWGVRARKEG